MSLFPDRNKKRERKTVTKKVELSEKCCILVEVEYQNQTPAIQMESMLMVDNTIPKFLSPVREKYVHENLLHKGESNSAIRILGLRRDLNQCYLGRVRDQSSIVHTSLYRSMAKYRKKQTRKENSEFNQHIAEKSNIKD